MSLECTLHLGVLWPRLPPSFFSWGSCFSSLPLRIEEYSLTLGEGEKRVPTLRGDKHSKHDHLLGVVIVNRTSSCTTELVSRWR